MKFKLQKMPHYGRIERKKIDNLPKISEKKMHTQ